MKKTLTILVGIVITLVTWGLIEPYFLDTNSYRYDLPRLSRNITVAQLSDFQVGIWLDNTATIKRAVQKTVEADPGIVVITGDFIYHSTDQPEAEMAKVMDLLSPLTKSNVPIFAVLGNHDYGIGIRGGDIQRQYAQKVQAALKKAGIEVLKNEAVPARNIWVVGLGSYLAKNTNPQKAFSSLPPKVPRLTIMHHPDSFARVASGSAPLAVAGHTHGGQVAFPFLPRWTWMTYIESDEVHADGWIAKSYGSSGNRLYVNRGIGFSVAPLRINAIPELTLFKLH